MRYRLGPISFTLFSLIAVAGFMWVFSFATSFKATTTGTISEGQLIYTTPTATEIKPYTCAGSNCPTGNTITVWYNPENPASYSVQDVAPAVGVVIGVIVLFAGAAIWSFVWLVRSIRAGVHGKRLWIYDMQDPNRLPLSRRAEVAMLNTKVYGQGWMGGKFTKPKE
jgi:hypothetical protein